MNVEIDWISHVWTAIVFTYGICRQDVVRYMIFSLSLKKNVVNIFISFTIIWNTKHQKGSFNIQNLVIQIFILGWMNFSHEFSISTQSPTSNGCITNKKWMPRMSSWSCFHIWIRPKESERKLHKLAKRIEEQLCALKWHLPT